MQSAQTRISIDVWREAGNVAKAMGLANERQAIEAVFRVFSGAYMQGATIAQTVTSAAPPSPERSSPNHQVNAAQAMSDLMSGLTSGNLTVEY